jgi:RNA polymerase sigma-70 factor, ECF subfamily
MTAPATKPNHESTGMFETDLEALIPYVRAFSYSLCRDRGVAEDLAQDTLTSAWRARSSFKAGTNMKAWLSTILRNGHKSHQRRSWRQVPWDPETADLIAAPPDEQGWACELSDVMQAAHCLTDQQNEALILITAAGLSYDEAAALTKVATGTMKSRVARGRRNIAKMLNGDDPMPTHRRSSWQSGLDHVLTDLQKYLPARTAKSFASLAQLAENS